MNINGMEIERKYMISMPDAAFLESIGYTEISQTYLLGEKGSTERVRKRGIAGDYVYTHTVKYKISSMSRREDEREISPGEYSQLLNRADPERITIEKRRYCYEYAGKLWEIDVFPFWADKAFMEIELCSEDEVIVFPPEINVLRELTEDKRYTNAALARQIPEE